jgi:hypothetical protein
MVSLFFTIKRDSHNTECTTCPTVTHLFFEWKTRKILAGVLRPDDEDMDIGPVLSEPARNGFVLVQIIKMSKFDCQGLHTPELRWISKNGSSFGWSYRQSVLPKTRLYLLEVSRLRGNLPQHLREGTLNPRKAAGAGLSSRWNTRRKFPGVDDRGVGVGGSFDKD